MATAIYPGSFNPFHEGHLDILEKSLKVFDHVVLGIGINPEKKESLKDLNTEELINKFPEFKNNNRITIYSYSCLLVEAITTYNSEYIHEIGAVIRGLRNGYDLQYETNMQYLNEDLGLKVPVVYFVTDRRYGHISSSAIRQIEKFKKGK